MTESPARVEIDGAVPTVEALHLALRANYGHYTVLQVRDGRARGFDLHLDRLATANRQLFDAGLDPDLVRHCIRHALAGTPDASVRVNLLSSQSEETPSIMVTVLAPNQHPAKPYRLRSVSYQRPLAQFKHMGVFGQVYHRRQVQRDGYDDALLTDADGFISEAAVSNVVFHDGDGLVWPDAPQLPGITMLLLEPRLPAAGVPSRRAPVRMSEAPAFRAAFVTSSTGVAPVGQIDDIPVPVDDRLLRTLTGVYEDVGWETI